MCLNNFGISYEGKTPYKRIDSVFNAESKKFGTDFMTRVSNINRVYPQTDKWELKNDIEKIARCYGLSVRFECQTYDSMWELAQYKDNDGNIVATLVFNE